MKHLVCLVMLLTGCSPAGRVALTFDDDFIDTWWEHRGLLEEYGVPATYFVTRWDTMTPTELDQLADLDAAGHEIAHHGLTHGNPKDYVAEHGVQGYVDDQVVPATAIMESHGYSPRAFAYPWGGRSAELDAALGEHFEVLRDSGRLSQTDRAVYESGDGLLTHGSRVDHGYFEMDDVTTAFTAADEAGGAIVLYAHRILEQSDASHITPDELEAILAEGADLGVEWITMSELR